MKKIKTLITAIASLVPCVMVPLSIASCNKPTTPTEEKHIIDPTEDEKKLEQLEEGTKLCGCALELTEDCTDDVFIVYAESPDGANLNFECGAEAYQTALVVGIKLTSVMPQSGTVDVPFNLTVVNYTKGWYQTINDYSFHFIPGALKDFVISYPSTVYMGTEGAKVSVLASIPFEAKIEKTEFHSSDTSVLEIDEKGVLTAKQAGKSAIITVSCNEKGGVILSKECEITVKEKIESFSFHFDGYNIDINKVFRPIVVDQDNNDISASCTFTAGPCEYNHNEPIGTFDGNVFTLSNEAKKKGGSSFISATLNGETISVPVEIGNYGYLEESGSFGMLGGGIKFKRDLLPLANKSVVLPSRFYNKHTDSWVELTNLYSFTSEYTPVYNDITSFFISKNISSITPGALAMCKIENLIVSENNHTFTSNIGGTEYNAVFNDSSTPDTLILGCTTTSTLPSSVTKLGAGCFVGTIFKENSGTIKTSVDLTNITSFGNSCFSLSNITEFTFVKNTIKIIPDSMFNNCYFLETVNFADDTQLITVDQRAFYKCECLTAIKGKNLKINSIGNSAFADCGFTTLDLRPWEIVEIGRSAFTNCKELTSVTMPKTVTSVLERVFAGCTKLVDETVGKGIIFEDLDTTWISDDGRGCDGIIVLNKNTGMSRLNGLFFNQYNIDKPMILNDGIYKYTEKDNNYYLAAGDKFYQNYVIAPKHLVTITDSGVSLKPFVGIADKGFEGKTCLVSKAILRGDGKNFVSIGTDAFKDCSNLETVVIGAGVNTIGADAFAGSNNIKTVTVDSAIIANSKDTCCNLFATAGEIQVLDSITVAKDTYIQKNFYSNHWYGNYQIFHRNP